MSLAPIKPKQTQLSRVLAALEEGPTTAPEMAAETGMPLKHCSAYLTALVSVGTVEKKGRMPREACEHCGKKPAGAMPFIYGLVAAKAVS